MDFDFSPEQELLRSTVRELCAGQADIAHVRAMERDDTGFSRPVWRKLANADLTGMTIPAESGGAAMSMQDAAIVYEEFGRALLPSPHFVSSVLAAGAIDAGADHSTKQQWLPGMASGDVVFSVAWTEPGGGYGPQGIRTEIRGGRLYGQKRHVTFANTADRLIVLAREAGSVVLAVVDPRLPGTTMVREASLASDVQYRLELDGAPVETVLAGGWEIWDRLLHRAIIVLAAQAVGGARAALGLAVGYAKQRHQFGKPLGAFQSIAHYLADAVTEVDGAEQLMRAAAWLADEQRPIRTAAPMAKLYCCDVFRRVTATAQQVFGGAGFTTELDIQLYFRRAKQLQLSWWDARYLEELIATATLSRKDTDHAA
ncbi:acyl-CoA dehydrogenase family protein [Nocardia australiensis]|uniref:acyl-CoA dehydrogenase family protein n=1 Tax=Nocardia australiensis TaxID=2887191 RepID=UPI001D14D575|nr:acyl-CoA dehydrogenase family protein [Nocardia australiensis]